MAFQRPHSRRLSETPIECIFRKTMKRQMTKAERRWFHLKVDPVRESTYLRG
jgi:hypothetical protein